MRPTFHNEPMLRIAQGCKSEKHGSLLPIPIGNAEHDSSREK